MSPSSVRPASPADDDPWGPLVADTDLLEAARRGDGDAHAELYRRHRDVAVRLAARLCDERDVDDVVSEAFAGVFEQLSRGAGPRTSFRAYLLTAVRHAHVDHVRRDVPHVWTDEVPEAPVGAAVEAGRAVAREESDVLSRAVRTLPRRWQLVLWRTLVEGRTLADVGDELDLTPNAAAALAFRAREGLRVAYVSQHVHQAAAASCRPWRDLLAPLATGRVGRRDVEVLGHLDGCRSCAEAFDDLRRLLPAARPAARAADPGDAGDRSGAPTPFSRRRLLAAR